MGQLPRGRHLAPLQQARQFASHRGAVVLQCGDLVEQRLTAELQFLGGDAQALDLGRRRDSQIGQVRSTGEPQGRGVARQVDQFLRGLLGAGVCLGLQVGLGSAGHEGLRHSRRQFTRAQAVQLSRQTVQLALRRRGLAHGLFLLGAQGRTLRSQTMDAGAQGRRRDQCTGVRRRALTNRRQERGNPPLGLADPTLGAGRAVARRPEGIERVIERIDRPALLQHGLRQRDGIALLLESGQFGGDCCALPLGLAQPGLRPDPPGGGVGREPDDLAQAGQLHQRLDTGSHIRQDCGQTLQPAHLAL